MFSHNGKISVRQVEILLILQMFNTTILLIPKVAARSVGRDGYILPIVAIALGIVYVYCIMGVTTKFPKDTLVEFAPKIVPKFIAYVIIILFAIKILITTGLEIRMFGEMVSQIMLPKTPLPVIILSILLTAAYLVKSGIEATARMAEILIYFIFIPLAIVFAIVIVRADYKQIMPFFQTDVMSIGKGALLISFSFMPIEFMLMMTGLMKKPEKAKRATLVAVICIAIIEAIIILLTYTGVGVNEVGRQVWPVLTLMQSIQKTGSIVENQEILMMTGWIFSIFMYISAGVYFISLIGSRSFKFKRENVFVLPIIPIVYFVAIFPQSLVEAYKYYLSFQQYFGIWFLIPIPLILTLIANARKVGNKNE